MPCSKSLDCLIGQESVYKRICKKLEVGNFITVDEIDYRINSNDDWMFAGGYYCYGLETLIGNTDKQEEIPDVDLGIGSYAQV